MADAQTTSAGISMVGGGIQQIFGGVLDVIGASEDFQAASKAAGVRGEQYREAMAQEDWAATDALRQGALAGAMRRMNGTSVAASQRVAYTAAGVDATSGTAARVGAATAAQAELGALIEGGNARRAALGHRMTSSRYALQQRQDRIGMQQQEAAFNLRGAAGTAKAAAGLMSIAGGAGLMGS